MRRGSCRFGCFNLINPVLNSFERYSAKFIPWAVFDPYTLEPFSLGVFDLTCFTRLFFDQNNLCQITHLKRFDTPYLGKKS